MNKANIFRILGWISLISCIISFLYYWDPTRIYFMGLKEKNAFAYEELPAKFKNINVSDHFKQTAQSLQRKELQSTIFGNHNIDDFKVFSDVTVYAYRGKFISADCNLFHPHANLTLCEIDKYAQWDSLHNIRRLSFNLEEGYLPKVYLFTPKISNQKLVLYHHGYAGNYHDQSYLIKQLLDLGYSVAAFNMVGYGDNALYRPNPWIEAVNGKFDAIETPLRPFFQPVLGTLNHLKSFKEINMIGLSAGGWVTAVSAALDPRIDHSYPIAGILPIFLRHGSNEKSPPQFYKPMLDIASYLDMFVLATDQPDRSQMQIFNRYDRCCFNNIRGKIYENEVQKRGLGNFSVLIDESHARHKISKWAFKQIIADLTNRETE